MVYDNIGKQLAKKTFQELSQEQIEEKQNSRSWEDPEGYRYIFPWSNGVLLRYFIRLYTESLPKSEYRRKAQIDDAGRSFVRNIEEGFKRPTTKEYLEFLGFSQGSLEEVKGDIRELAEDKFLKSSPGSSLVKLGIDLKEFNFALRKKRQQYSTLLKENVKGSPNSSSNLSFKSSSNFSSNTSSNLSSKISPNAPLLFSNLEFYYQDICDLYPSLKKIQAEDLTYEIFMELINKTDYVTRQLVVSLEKKMANEGKYYQLEQIKLNRKSKGTI